LAVRQYKGDEHAALYGSADGGLSFSFQAQFGAWVGKNRPENSWVRELRTNVNARQSSPFYTSGTSPDSSNTLYTAPVVPARKSIIIKAVHFILGDIYFWGSCKDIFVLAAEVYYRARYQVRAKDRVDNFQHRPMRAANGEQDPRSSDV